MGGLWKYLPVTYGVMLIGTIAITGMGIPGFGGFAGFAGFYSKDTIIEAAYAASHTSGVGGFAFVAGVLAAGLTAFYSWRLVFMTFHGHAKWGPHAVPATLVDDHASQAQIESHSEPLPDDDHAHAHDDHGHADHGHGHDHTPHDSPLTMLVPICLLALGAIGAGYLFVETFVGPEQVEFWRGAIFNAPDNHILHMAHTETPFAIKLLPLAVSLLGLFVAWYVYIAREGLGAKIAAEKGPLWSFLYNKWYFDEIYEATFVRLTRFLGDLFWKGGDQKLIDGLGPNGVSWLSYVVGRGTGRLQTGYVYHYAFVMLLGIAGLLGWFLFMWSR
jgi:NADH-quinone oxidoreductase subunit L